MKWVQPRISCACIEAEGIAGSSVEKFIYEYSLQVSRVGKHYRTVLFSDAVRLHSGRALAKLLKPHGALTTSPQAPNPIHDNQPIEVFIWQPHDDFLKTEMPKIVKTYIKTMTGLGYGILPQNPIMHTPGA